MPTPKQNKIILPVDKEQEAVIRAAIRYVQEGGYTGSDAGALAYICDTWLRKAEEERRGNESDVIPF